MDILKTVLISIQLVCGIPMVWSLIVLFVSCFKKKRIPPVSEKKNSFAVVICAHNEERTIGLLINSIGMTDYPKDKLHIYVLAHNCTDNTAEVVRRFSNATVIEVNDDTIKSKGELLNRKLSGIIEAHMDEIDAVTFFDADNVADVGFFNAVNDYISDGANIIMGNRIAGGTLDSLPEKLMAAYWIVYDNLISVARDTVGLSPCITGTGFTISKEYLLEHPWKTRSITEDVEYSVDSMLKGQPVSFCPNANFFDEQPDNFKSLSIQLHRWCTGAYEILGMYFKGLFKGMWKDIRVFDHMMNMFLGPTAVIAMFIFLILFVITLIQFDVPLLIFTLAATLGGFVLVAIATIIFMLGTKDKEVKKKLLPVAFLTPIFLVYYTVCSFFAWVHPQKRWVPIAHKGLSNGKK